MVKMYSSNWTVIKQPNIPIESFNYQILAKDRWKMLVPLLFLTKSDPIFLKGQKKLDLVHYWSFFQSCLDVWLPTPTSLGVIQILQGEEEVGRSHEQFSWWLFEIPEPRLLWKLSTFSPKVTLHKLRLLCTKEDWKCQVQLLTQSGSYLFGDALGLAWPHFWPTQLHSPCTKWRFLPKNLSQLVIFMIELAFT